MPRACVWGVCGRLVRRAPVVLAEAAVRALLEPADQARPAAEREHEPAAEPDRQANKEWQSRPRPRIGKQKRKEESSGGAPLRLGYAMLWRLFAEQGEARLCYGALA